MKDALFNYERSLARLGGDPKLFAEIVDLFLQDSPLLLQQARNAIAASDTESLARAAHSLKNLSANFDAVALSQAAASVEQQALDGGLDRAEACFEDMQQELTRLQSALSQLQKTDNDR